MNREDYNEYMRKYYYERYYRRKAEATEKLGGYCKKCGSMDSLDFDHIDPNTKEFTITDMWNLSNERFWKEVGKCQLLCRPCHVEKTRQDFGSLNAKETHGTLSSYKYCKCAECRMAKSGWMKTYNDGRRHVAF
jgi:hypothetical protein